MIPVPYGSSLASAQRCSSGLGRTYSLCCSPGSIRFGSQTQFCPTTPFNSCRAGFLVRDVLTVIRWRVQIVDLRPHKTITNPNRFAADFFRVRHLAHASTYQLRIATFASCPKGIPWCASNHGFCRYPHRKVLSVEPIGELRTVPPDFELCSAYWPKLKTTPA